MIKDGSLCCWRSTAAEISSEEFSLGSKTEPMYFRYLIQELGLTTAQVKVTGDGGSSPINVVKDAQSFLQRDSDFEHVFLVFDRDRHESYD